MLARLLRLLVPLAPRRHPRLFPIFRRGRFQTGLFRSRPLRPTPSPRPRTQPLQRRPAAPSQPQPSSPTRQKIRPKLSLASPPPEGAGWREIAPPSPPPNPHRPPPTLSPARSPRPPAAVPLRTPNRPPNPRHTAPTKPRSPTPHPAPPVARRGQAHPRTSRKTPRRTSRVFWKKLLRAQSHPISRPSSDRDLK